MGTLRRPGNVTSIPRELGAKASGQYPDDRTTWRARRFRQPIVPSPWGEGWGGEGIAVGYGFLAVGSDLIPLKIARSHSKP